MRIISQDGMIDVPYELGNLNIGVGKFEDVERASISYYYSSTFNAAKLAEYTSKAKAKKAMEMLHREWDDCGVNGRFQFPADDVEGKDE